MIGHYFSILVTLASHRLLLLTFLAFSVQFHICSQAEIGWQKTIGTLFDDDPLLILSDDQGHIYVFGNEPHEDFTGLLRPYMMLAKLDAEGEVIWKTYHDVAFNTFSPPVEFSVSGHFFTTEFDTELLNLVMRINNQTILYKIEEASGSFFYHETIVSEVIDVDEDNAKVYAHTLCSVQQSCYGPDSLVVERFDPTPDSIIFNPIIWTFELKQNIRTTPIQGHYDFDVQDIRTDAAGNTYLLVQIQRWDFQFCTDCADAFVDAWCEVFKLDPQGQLIRHVNLKTAKAVVSRMTFVDMDETSMLVQINDINAAGTKVITSLHRVDHDLDLIRKFDLDDLYTVASDGSSAMIYGVGQESDPANPAIHGLTDVVLSMYTADGEPAGKHYFGGSSWEFVKGITLGTEGYPVLLVRADSDDFDVLDHVGGADMWIVKLAEEGSTAVNGPDLINSIAAFPNPCQSWVSLDTPNLEHGVIYDPLGRRMNPSITFTGRNTIDMQPYAPGIYVLQVTDADGKSYFARVIRQD